MTFVLKSLAALVVGIALGLFATWMTVVRGAMPGGASDGPWHTNMVIGDAAGDPHTRARVALHGLFALNRSETVYYTAATDGAGAKLASNCTYTIEGRDPDTRWWSITAYAEDDYLIANPAHRYSVSKNSVRRNADGSFAATVSRTAAAQNWIPLGDDGDFTLTLRLYNPGARVVKDPAHAALPAIRKAGCQS